MTQPCWIPARDLHSRPRKTLETSGRHVGPVPKPYLLWWAWGPTSRQGFPFKWSQRFWPRSSASIKQCTVLLKPSQPTPSGKSGPEEAADNPNHCRHPSWHPAQWWSPPAPRMDVSGTPAELLTKLALPKSTQVIRNKVGGEGGEENKIMGFFIDDKYSSWTIKWCLIVEEMQSRISLMSTTLSNLWSVIAVSTAPNFLILESLWPRLTFHFLYQHLPSFSGFHSDTSPVPPVLLPTSHLGLPTCCGGTAFCCGTCVSASVFSPFVHLFPLHRLYCLQFYSTGFCSSFLIFMTIHHSGKWKLYISLFTSKTQVCIARGDKNNMICLGVFPQLPLLTMNCS